jgi:hypothetical protein
MKWLSRKLLLSVGGFITLIAQGQYQEAAAVIVGYVFANSAGKIAEALKPKVK